MAGVYRAWDMRLRVWRAAKVLLPEFARKQKLRLRFEREAHTMARLEHRNLVRVFDVGNSGQLPFIVMELVPCGTLMQWIERHGPMPSRMATQCALQICDGLATVHRNNVVHRDIKPHNVLINEHGVLKLTDFGIAQQADEGLTRAGSVMGTMGYMAPEQRNDASTVDHRADIYGIGATLWKVLTDKPVRDLFMYAEDPAILEGIDEGVAEVLMACLAYTREGRPDSIEEVADALAAVLEGLPDDPPGTPALPLDGVIERGEERASTFEEIAPAFTLTDEGPVSSGPVSIAPVAAELSPPKSLPGLPYGVPQKLSAPDDGTNWVAYEDEPITDDYLGDDDYLGNDDYRGDGEDLVGPPSMPTEGFGDEGLEHETETSAPSLYEEPPPREVPVFEPEPPKPPPPEPSSLGPVVRIALVVAVLFLGSVVGGVFLVRGQVVEASQVSQQATQNLYLTLDQERNVVTELVTLDRSAQVLEGLFLDYLDHPREPERWARAERFLAELDHYAKVAEGASGAEGRNVQQRVARIQAARDSAAAAREAYQAKASGFPGALLVNVGAAPRP